MGTSRGRREERRLQQEANTATAAVQPTAYEMYQKPRDLGLLADLDAGKDVSEIDGLRWTMNLFNNAGRDPNLSGTGLLGNNQLAGANGKLAALISEQVKGRERQQREGDLYNAVGDARSGAMARSQGFAGMEEGRNRFRADMANQRYTAYLNRPRQPSFWEQMALGGIQAAGQAGAAAAMA